MPYEKEEAEKMREAQCIVQAMPGCYARVECKRDPGISPFEVAEKAAQEDFASQANQNKNNSVCAHVRLEDAPMTKDKGSNRGCDLHNVLGCQPKSGKTRLVQEHVSYSSGSKRGASDEGGGQGAQGGYKRSRMSELEMD
jgi:hypothetical protein